MLQPYRGCLIPTKLHRNVRCRARPEVEEAQVPRVATSREQTAVLVCARGLQWSFTTSCGVTPTGIPAAVTSVGRCELTYCRYWPVSLHFVGRFKWSCVCKLDDALAQKTFLHHYSLLRCIVHGLHFLHFRIRNIRWRHARRQATAGSLHIATARCFHFVCRMVAILLPCNFSLRHSGVVPPSSSRRKN